MFQWEIAKVVFNTCLDVFVSAFVQHWCLILNKSLKHVKNETH